MMTTQLASVRGLFVALSALTVFSLHARGEDIVIGMSAAFTGPSRGLGIESFGCWIGSTQWSAGFPQSVMLSLLVVAGVAIYFVLWRRITRPLMRLARHAEDLASGRAIGGPNDAAIEELLLDACRGDEVGQLARAFHHMIEEVAARELSLREAERDVRRSELHFRSLIENVTDVIMKVNADGFADYVSRRFMRCLVWPRKIAKAAAFLSSFIPTTKLRFTRRFVAPRRAPTRRRPCGFACNDPTGPAESPTSRSTTC